MELLMKLKSDILLRKVLLKIAGIIFFYSLSGLQIAHAQAERKEIRQGVREYSRESYPEAELSFRKALSIDSTSVPALYDLAASLYRQQRFEEAKQLLESLAGKVSDPSLVADVFHNLGNSFLSEKDYQKSIEAYKNSLRVRPFDMDTKYNLAYAQEMLKNEQQQQSGGDQDKQQDEQDKQENEQDEQENQSPDNQDQPQDQGKDQKEMNQSISKEDMERLLQAIQQNEKKVKEKADKEKAKAAAVKTEKDW